VYHYCVAKQRGQDFDTSYINNTVAKDIAPYWNDLGIELGVKRLDNIKEFHNPTEYKFQAMLKKWLQGQKGCTQRDTYQKFYEALQGIELIRAAEVFKEKASLDIN